MKVLARMILIGLAGAMISCAPSGDKPSFSRPRGIDNNGNCTQETVDAMNSIIEHIQTYDQTKDKKYYNDVKASCDRLQSLIGAYSCQAINKSTQKEEKASYEDYGKICEEAELGIK